MISLTPIGITLTLTIVRPEETLGLFKYVLHLHNPNLLSLSLQQTSANVFGGLNLARAVLPGMRARREGTILWSGSLFGRDPVPIVGAYCASKICVRGM